MINYQSSLINFTYMCTLKNALGNKNNVRILLDKR